MRIDGLGRWGWVLLVSVFLSVIFFVLLGFGFELGFFGYWVVRVDLCWLFRPLLDSFDSRHRFRWFFLFSVGAGPFSFLLVLSFSSWFFLSPSLSISFPFSPLSLYFFCCSYLWFFHCSPHCLRINLTFFFLLSHSKRQASTSRTTIRHPLPTHHHTNQRTRHRANAAWWGVVYLCWAAGAEAAYASCLIRPTHQIRGLSTFLPPNSTLTANLRKSESPLSSLGY